MMPIGMAVVFAACVGQVGFLFGLYLGFERGYLLGINKREEERD